MPDGCFQFSRTALGDTLRSARKRRALSLRELASLSGVSASHILRIESGEYDFQAETLVKLAMALRVPLGLVLDESLVVPAETFVRAIRKAEDTGKLLPPKSHGLYPIAVKTCAHGCVILAKLCMASNPSMILARIKWPHADLFTWFQAAAANIALHGFTDRAGIIDAINKTPLLALAELIPINSKWLSTYAEQVFMMKWEPLEFKLEPFENGF